MNISFSSVALLSSAPHVSDGSAEKCGAELSSAELHEGDAENAGL